MINTLRYAKMMEEVGFSREQAETSVKILVDVMEEKLASKQDLQDLRVATQQDFQNFRLATQHDIQNAVQELRTDTQQAIQELRTDTQQAIQDVRIQIAQSELKLTVRMGTMMAASIAVLTAIQKLT